MKKHDKHILDKLSSLFPAGELNQFTIIPLFGGSGVCSNNVIFAWIYNQQLYIKGHNDYLDTLTELNMMPLSINLGMTAKLLQYYQVTDSMWDNPPKLANLMKMVIEYAHLSKTLKYQIKEERIKDLPNITLSLERSLFRAGIANVDSFRHQGAFTCYFKLKKYNKNLSTNVLYILHCALLGLHVATLSEEQKKRIKNEYKNFVASMR